MPRHNQMLVRDPEATPLTPLVDSKVCGVLIAADGSTKEFPADLTTIVKSDARDAAVAARIYMVQGGESLLEHLDDWIRRAPGPRHAFVQGHLGDDGGAEFEQEVGETGVNALSTSWWRFAPQDRHQNWIHRRILANRPYSINTIDDPMNLRLGHQRYSPVPRCQYRSYHLISFSRNGEQVYNAAQERMSLYSYVDVDGVLTVLVLADPRRKYQVRGIKFSFWKDQENSTYETIPCFRQAKISEAAPDQGEGSEPNTTTTNGVPAAEEKILDPKRHVERDPASWFLQILGQYAETPSEATKLAIAHIICEDVSCILDNIRRALGDIELALHDDIILRESMPRWREQLGSWRYILCDQSMSLAFLSQHLGFEDTAPRGHLQGFSGASTGVNREDRLRHKLKRLGEDASSTSHRIEATFQALMSSITIVESERAIKETEAVPS
ncbi:hypothetical protein MFIFM68171_00922 [Madurella fahalii]|uniref:Uncharacterized protein n=1 Tax=Madurella fahalii TaxID=1157608 RepID=A0ABQ0FYX9_9PEZI